MLQLVYKSCLFSDSQIAVFWLLKASEDIFIISMARYLYMFFRPCIYLYMQVIFMDFRKIIKFGKASFIVSLPKDWLLKHNLKQGDHVHVDEVNDNLVLLPKRVESKKELLSIEIDVSRLETREIKRRIVSAYVRNYNVIHIYGKDLESKARSIKETIQNIMALEIMEETSDRIIAKDFLNMDDISLTDLLKRMDIIMRSMYMDCINGLGGDLYHSINERDADVNRLTFLVHRTLNYYFLFPALASERNLSNRKLIRIGLAAQNIERIADNAKRIAKLFGRISFNKKQKQKVKEILDTIYVSYENIMKAFYKEDIDLAFRHANEKKVLISSVRQLYDDIWRIKWASTVLEKMKDTISCVHSIGRAIYL